jgi:hypothetical protein
MEKMIHNDVHDKKIKIIIDVVVVVVVVVD